MSCLLAAKAEQPKQPCCAPPAPASATHRDVSFPRQLHQLLCHLRQLARARSHVSILLPEVECHAVDDN